VANLYQIYTQIMARVANPDQIQAKKARQMHVTFKHCSNIQ